MSDEKTSLSLAQRVHRRLSRFFSEPLYTEEEVAEGLHTGDIFFSPADILPYLQTPFVDDKYLEVEMNGVTQIYFSRIHDHPPVRDEESPEHTDEYTPGDYLKDNTHLIILPLEPGMGNYSIRFCGHLVLRYFTQSYAVELGTFFQDQIIIDTLPVLRLDYPVIGRIVRGEREYRAKVPKDLDIKLLIIGKKKQKSFTSKLLNISVSGFAFYITKAQQEFFTINEERPIEIIINDVMEIRLSAAIRHISKIRGKNGTEYVCGVQATLPTRAAAARLEEIVAQVQRAHLRELSKLSKESGIELIK